MLKIRRPLGRLIFNMGIAIPGKTVFLIETAPWALTKYFCGRPDAPIMWIFKGPMQILDSPPKKWNTNSPILLEGPLGPEVKSNKGPIGFSGAWGPKLYLAPESTGLGANYNMTVWIFGAKL